MADELRSTLTTQYANGSSVDGNLVKNSLITQSVAGVDVFSASVTTAEADITFPSIATLGWLRIRNTDATNFVKYGPKSGGAMVVFGKLKAGEEGWFRMMTGITLRMIADTATCKVQFRAFND